MAARPLLVIDDDAALAEVITSILAEDGYTVETVTSTQDARRLLEEYGPEDFCLVLSDSFSVHSPDVFAWPDQVRGLTTAPIVISSAHPACTFTGWEERGFAGVLPKPFDIDVLTALVVEVCGQPES